MTEKMFGEDGMNDNTETNDIKTENNENIETAAEPVNETPAEEVKAEKPAADAAESASQPQTAQWTNTDVSPQRPAHGYPPFEGFNGYNAATPQQTPPQNNAQNAGYAPYNGAQQQYNSNPYNGGADYGPNSGEYRYRPPYATYGSNCPPPHAPHMGGPASPAAQPPYEAPKKQREPKKVKGRTFSMGAVALLLVACVLLSFGAGFGGAYVSLHVSGNGEAGSITGSSDDMVIYKSAMVTDQDGNAITSALTVPAVEEIVADSVVEITTEVLTSYGPYQYVSEGAGSGVIISENGYIITNNHVIVGDSSSVADTITVRLKNTTEYEATVVGTDSESDIALLKIEATGLKAAIIGESDSLVVGESIVAVGNPLGELGGTVTSGIVSATGRTINVDGTDMNLIQIDAAVNPGNSGGGLFNMKGELVGIVNAKSTGEGVEGLGFAIPVNDAINVSEQIKENGYVTGRTYIGVLFLDVTDAFTAYRYFGSQTLGVYVYEAQEGYNEDNLKSGDRIVAVNGTEITSSDDIKTIVKAAEVGDVLKFTVYRKGTLTEVDVTCYEYVPETTVDFNQQ